MLRPNVRTAGPWLLVTALFLTLPLCVGCGESPKDAATLKQEAEAMEAEVNEGESSL